MTPDRRSFIRSALACAAGTTCAPLFSSCAAGDSGRGFIDAHVHVWTPDTESYPLAEGYSEEKMKPPSFTPEELLRVANPSGVDRIVLIQMSFYRFDNSYMLGSMRRFPGVFSGVAVVDHEAPGLADRMKKLKSEGVRGFRLYTGRSDAEALLGSAEMKKMWAIGADEGLSMCLLANPEDLPAIHGMCAAYPRTSVVIDHLARIGAKGPINQGDLDALCGLAEFPHTHVKTSAFYALGKKAAPYTDLGPMIRRLRDAYGAERLMWATDCPYQLKEGHTYDASVALIRDRLDFLSDDERAAILRGTAERVFFS